MRNGLVDAKLISERLFTLRKELEECQSKGLIRNAILKDLKRAECDLKDVTEENRLLIRVAK